MNKIFLVLRNLKHNGEELAKGSLFEGTLEGFQQLVDMGVLRVVEGAETLEQAAEIVKGEVDAAVQKAEATAAVAPKDVWAPQPAKEEVAATDAAHTQETAPEKAADTEVAPVVGEGDKPPVEAAAPAAGTETGENL